MRSKDDMVSQKTSDALFEGASRIVSAVSELFPKSVGSPEEVKALLHEIPEGSYYQDGSIAKSDGVEFLDVFSPPNALEDPRIFRLARSVKAGRRAIRSARVVEVSEFSTFALQRPPSYAVSVPIGFGLRPDANFNLPTERRYYRELGDDIEAPGLEAAARAVYEVSAGIDGREQRSQLKADIKTHERIVEENSQLFGDEAIRRDKKDIDQLFAEMKVFRKETGKDPMKDMADFITWAYEKYGPRIS